ncbi:protein NONRESPONDING TO OXYLIPINS 2, mitochondrial isoform X6 [Diospyros lotus]|uniref:protein NONRESPONDING TO OXYLIPINS 2, mitochondrial isoform X6 n=1 Tax=Diospyros lotus TaxID=55363 RepID=UPI00225396ED|nr:protein NONRESPONDING TO OXYLIPINS 2, mitochondrial isoform X6 [Diospyros lotus]
MASRCSRFINRSSMSSLKSAIKSTIGTASGSIDRSATPRSPSELGCLQSLLPLHSAVAVARMTSCLSSTSRSCRALSQGT